MMDVFIHNELGNIYIQVESKTQLFLWAIIMLTLNVIMYIYRPLWLTLINYRFIGERLSKVYD